MRFIHEDCRDCKGRGSICGSTCRRCSGSGMVMIAIPDEEEEDVHKNN